MKVRLKQRDGGHGPFARTRFNSMKVRLKPVSVMNNNLPISFQFHEGPIKTVEKSNQEARGAAFQFHEGPIKT